MPGKVQADWVAVDCGTTNLRAWAMAGAGPIDSVSAALGMARLEPHEFEPSLLGLIGHWLRPGAETPVVACGMVGARQGWVEAPYAPVPAPPLRASALMRVETADPRISFAIVHGLSQSSQPDVMRGEETQIAGLLSRDADFSGTICLPGTHTKWATVVGGCVTGFRTFMTGELFGLLADRSILRHSVGGAEKAMDEGAFDDAVTMAATEPAAIGSRLFSIRAATLLGGLSEAQARSRLSGLLIGTEVASMLPVLHGGRVAIVGADALSGAYRKSLALLGAGRAELHDAEGCTLAGLTAARRLLPD